jgi:hypothetical protein
MRTLEHFEGEAKFIHFSYDIKTLVRSDDRTNKEIAAAKHPHTPSSGSLDRSNPGTL